MDVGEAKNGGVYAPGYAWALSLGAYNCFFRIYRDHQSVYQPLESSSDSRSNNTTSRDDMGKGESVYMWGVRGRKLVPVRKRKRKGNRSLWPTLGREKKKESRKYSVGHEERKGNLVLMRKPTP